MGEPDLFDYLLTKLEGKCSNKGRDKIYRTEEAYETYLPKNDIKGHFFPPLFWLTLILILSKFQQQKFFGIKQTSHAISLVSPPCKYFDHVGVYNNISGQYGG